MTSNESASRKQQPPFPVVLDLSDNNAFAVLTQALTDYAERARWEAQNETEAANANEYQIADFNKMADIADRLNADVERQLDEAGKATS